MPSGDVWTDGLNLDAVRVSADLTQALEGCYPKGLGYE